MHYCTLAFGRRFFLASIPSGSIASWVFSALLHSLDKYVKFTMSVNFADLNDLASVRFDLRHLDEGKELFIQN